LKKKILFSTVVILLLFSCSKKEADLFIVTAHGIKYNRALLYWNNVFPNAEQSKFQVYFNEKIVAEFADVYSYELNDLKEATTYSGKVVSNDTVYGRTYTAYYSFTTLKNSPPYPIKININFITSSSISINWNKPFDADGDTVTYDIIINNQIAAENLTVSQDTITGLEEYSYNTLIVSANDGQGNSRKDSVKFLTLRGGEEIRHCYETFGDLEREYGVFIPSNPDSEQLPLFVFIHGATGVVWPEMIKDDLVYLAKEEKFVVLKPQGRFACDNGESCWGYDDNTDPDFISDLIDSVIVRCNIDTERIYMAGHSNGAFITYYMADYIEEKLAAIGPSAGTLGPYQYNRFRLNKPMPLCHIHGTDDATVPVDGNATHVSLDKILEYWIPNNNVHDTPIIYEIPDRYPYDNSTVSKIVYNTINPSSGDIIYYRINNGNHTLPGVQAWGNQDIHAYEVLWDFFKTRKLSDK
jgi:poly(3-hydroxybutyrate) depolymerase